MKRKVIRQGHNTLTVTLPSGWAQSLNLKAGDEIEVVEKENTLIVNADHNGKAKTAVIDIRNFTIPLLWRYFSSAYRAGNDEIKILFDPHQKKFDDAYHYYTSQFDYSKLGEKIPPKPALAMIQEVVNRFVGVDIIESGDGYVIVKELGEVSTKEFENSLRRIFLVILQMFERLKEAIKNDEIGEASLCKEIHAIDLNVDKFVDYCCRILNKIDVNFPANQKPIIFSSLFLLELIGDEFKYIGKHIALSKKPVKEVLELLELTEEHFKLYYKMYHSFSRDLSIELGKKDVEVYESHYRTKEHLKGESRSIMKHLMIISKFTLSLAELRIQMEF
jgi:antitoxin component of MazEF toxin-antitoxin module